METENYVFKKGSGNVSGIIVGCKDSSMRRAASGAELELIGRIAELRAERDELLDHKALDEMISQGTVVVSSESVRATDAEREACLRDVMIEHDKCIAGCDMLGANATLEAAEAIRKRGE